MISLHCFWFPPLLLLVWISDAGTAHSHSFSLGFLLWGPAGHPRAPQGPSIQLREGQLLTGLGGLLAAFSPTAAPRAGPSPESTLCAATAKDHGIHTPEPHRVLPPPASLPCNPRDLGSPDLLALLLRQQAPLCVPVLCFRGQPRSRKWAGPESVSLGSQPCVAHGPMPENSISPVCPFS